MVTKDELEELISDCPSLYHMAERGAWLSIQERGLLSTSALLDLYDVNGKERENIEQVRRPECVTINKKGLPQAVIRDQIPMDDGGLRRGLPNKITPNDWYRLLNSKVFFWLTKDRLHRLTGAKAYKEKEHDVIQLDTRKLINVHYGNIVLCPINSGCTKPFPAKRDYNSFLPIDKYPYDHWRSKRGKRGDKVVELVIKYSVPDLVDFVQCVTVMKGDKDLEVLYQK